MRFGPVPTSESLGGIVAHAVRRDGLVLKKGDVVGAGHIAALRAAGIHEIVVAQLEPGDVGEDPAASRLAGAIAGANLRVDRAFTGRANLFAECAGVFRVDEAMVARVNEVDEAVTLATLPAFRTVVPGEMVATVKIIPFAVAGSVLAAALAAAGTGGLSIAPFRPLGVGVVSTLLPGLKPSVVDKTVRVLEDRLRPAAARITLEERVPHDRDRLAAALETLQARSDLTVVFGASAITDRRDVIPAAIETAGGRINHFGMPVDPGNLMLMGRVGATPVLGLPGCARSPKVNGFDWILQRLLADLPAGPREIMGMGVGGLLADIPSRPLPRALATPEAVAPSAAPRAPRIAALVLAAGQSRRMGTLNKLLIEIDGVPMVRRVVEMLRQSRADPIVVVTGHQRERVADALKDLPVTITHNPDFAQGLSTSLKAGIGALGDDVDGVLVCLGDMPRVSAAEVDRLIGAFNPVEGRGIIVPTLNGKRGNPVLWSKRFFSEMTRVAGDVGARHLIGAYPEMVAEVEMAGDGVLTDIDTPQALAKLAATGVKVTA